MRYTKSEEAMKVAETLMPGGVNSPVRAFKSVDTPAIFMDHGKGSKIYDIDGNEYIDYVLSWGPLILGHRDPQVISHLIVKFEGCYHGHSDSLLIKAGSGVATLGLPDSPGVPEGIAKNTITVPYNDLDALKIAFEKFGDDIAGVIVEPVAGNMGVVPPIEGFLQGLRDITTEYGALLIFDEVMTGFRVGYHCAQGHFGVTPDLTCLGKVIGGGLPVGAFGGKKEIMDHIAPLGNIYQAGTLSGNPLAMTSGYETLSQLTPETYEYFNMLGDILEDGLKRVFAKHNVPITVNRAGSMIGYFLNEGPVTNFEQANKSDLKLFAEMYREMAKEGVFLPPSQFEGTFLSTAHTKEDIEKTIQAFDTALSRIVK